jgi:signal transduction histidine kinase
MEYTVFHPITNQFYSVVFNDMSPKFKPITRLSIIFILAIVLSGGILIYFSINNILNLKELTEKRILEEQRDLISRFSVALQNKIEEVIVRINDETGQPGLIIDSLAKTAAEHDFIIQPFILKEDGRLIYPNFNVVPEKQSGPILSEQFNNAFRQGEKAEFAEKNPGKAKNYYLTCLHLSSGMSDSVKALNALGRISVKLNDAETSIHQYSLIISDYFSQSDENGIPYAYYALPQLLKISNKHNFKKKLPVVISCLDEMENGSIPLNYNTKDLLITVEKWLKENNNNNQEELPYMNKLIRGINQQIQFVNIYIDELSKLLKNVNTENRYAINYDFNNIKFLPGKYQHFLLINTKYTNTVGFLFDREKLFDTIIKAGLQDGYNFNYKIEFPDRHTSNTTRQGFTYSTQLNPWFPGTLIGISLENRDMLKNYISRRSWIYGISTVLLLLAMILGVVLILRDIAREKHLTSLRSDFISNVTHELKTPLTSIRMYAESLLLGRVKQVSNQQEYLSTVINESERLKRMINNILEFSKMEKDKQEYHMVKTRLSETLYAAIGDMNYWLKEKGFNIITEIDRNIMLTVDPEKLRQVFTNLLSNAIKYSGNSKKIYARLYKNSANIIIEVEDEGIGIAPDKLTKIFEEFYRIDQEESVKITGTGLGLTVVKEIVEAHNGKILVDSKIGKGSKFSIILYPQ